MADFHPTQNAAFNALLHRLHETASELAQLYQKDVEGAAHENAELRHRSSGSVADGRNGSEISPAEVIISAAEANVMVLSEREVIQNLQKTATPIAQSVPLFPSQQYSQSSHFHMGSSQRPRFHMRSPWIDHRDLDNFKLSEVMSEMPNLRISAAVTLAEAARSDENVPAHIYNFRLPVVHPESRVRGWWIVASIVLLLYDFILIPVDVSFDLQKTAFSKVMDHTAATFWTIDVVFTFFVGVQQAHNVEMKPSRIACLYLKSWLIFDLMLVIPGWVTLAMADANFSGGQVSVFRMARWGRLMRLLRMARILRLGKLKPLMRRLIHVLNLSKVYIQLMQALAGLSLALLAFIHITSCFWYAIGNSSDDGWVSVNGLQSASVGRAYATSLRWSFSRLNGMQTNNEMKSVNELVLDAVLICVSLMLAAYYYGTVAAVAITRANSNSFNSWRVSILFVMKYKISDGLENRMTRFLECSAAGGALEAAAEEVALLESLPKTLQHELLFEARMPFLSHKPFLHDMLSANPRVLHEICIEAVEQKIYVVGEMVFAKGDACHCMFFVMSGVLYYISHDTFFNLNIESIQDRLHNPLGMGLPSVGDSGAIHVGKKTAVSEPVLWTHWTHVGGLLTIKESESLVLSQSGFAQVVAEHREVSCYAFKYAKRFLWRLNNTSLIDDLTAYDEINIRDLDADMFEGTEYDHFMFLSHYKVEAGTEATLMRDLCLEALREDPSHSANNLRSPIFVDSEDLSDLSKLKEHVKGSCAFVLLLTPAVLSRPWCLIEIVTAVEHQVDIVPVDIQRHGCKYSYPDDQFYSDILEGKFLNRSAVDLLGSEGVSLSDVEQALRKVFCKIALPFSPHKSRWVREAEVHDIFARIGEVLVRSGSASYHAA